MSGLVIGQSHIPQILEKCFSFLKEILLHGRAPGIVEYQGKHTPAHVIPFLGVSTRDSKKDGMPFVLNHPVPTPMGVP